MEPMAEVFDRMDAWRHLPKYQLERRADLFFSLYLPEVLESKLGAPMCPDVTPEFPVRKATIYPGLRGDDCCNIDYLALSATATESVFVELKTDRGSRRARQDDYLLKAQEAGLPNLLEGVCSIFRATKKPYRPKWLALLHLEQVGLPQVPVRLKDIMGGDSHRGAPEASRGIVITAPTSRPHVVYVQPHEDVDDDVIAISFGEYAEIVARHADSVSQRFAASLVEWAKVPAGS